MITAIVMAAGSSKRMGVNKLHLPIKDKEMYEYVVDLLSEFEFEKILVTNDEDIRNYAIKRKFKVVKNENASTGKASTIKCGIKAADESTSSYFFFVSDQPFLSKETISKIVEEFNKDETKIIVPYYGKKRGAPMLFPKKYKERLLSLSADEGGVVLITSENSNKVYIDNEIEHMDFDVPEDIINAKIQ